MQQHLSVDGHKEWAGIGSMLKITTYKAFGLTTTLTTTAIARYNTQDDGEHRRC